MKTSKKLLAIVLSTVMALTVLSCAVFANTAKPVNWLINPLDKIENVSVFHATASVDTQEKTEGTGSMKLTESDGMIQFHMRDYFNTLRTVDLTGSTYISFDLYTEDVNMFKQGDKAIEFFDTLNRCSGRMGTSEALAALTLVNGWNNIKIQLGAYDTTSGFDPKNFQHINFFASSVSTTATYRFDNFRIGNDEGYAMIDVLTADGFSTLNSGYTCYAIQNIDSTDSTEGNSCLKITTFEGYNMVSVLLNQPGNITGATYMVFDIYTGDVNLFSEADDTAVSFFNNDVYSGRAVISRYLKEAPLQSGWNHVVVPLSYSELTDSFDASSLNKIEFYIYRINGYPEGTVIKLDNVRFCNYEGLLAQSDAEKAEDLIDAIGEVSLSSADAIAAADAAYSVLPENVLSLVDNYGVLTAAKETYALIENQKIDFTVDIQDAEASVEREMIVPIYVTVEEGQNVAACQLAVEYDKTKVEFVNADIMLEDVYFDFNASAEGYDSQVLLALTKDSGIIESGIWFNLTFKALADGEAEFSVKSYDKDPCDADSNTLTMATMNGSAVIGKLLGDVDFSGVVDSSDALHTLKAAVKKVTFNEDEMVVGDVNGDDIVTAHDALLILQYAVGKITTFPIEK